MALLTFSRKRVRTAYHQLLDAVVEQNFIQILSYISMIGIGICTAALVIALSYFNGMERFTVNMYNRFSPELLIKPKEGKVFTYDEKLKALLLQQEGISEITEVLEDNALLISNDKQKVITIKGVTDNYYLQNHLDTTIIEGSHLLVKNGTERAILGLGIKHELGININQSFAPLQIWYPKRQYKGVMTPETAFNRSTILPGGVFSAESQVDATVVIVPISMTEHLLNHSGNRSSLEIKVAKTWSAVDLQEELQEVLGNQFEILTQREQQADILMALEIEKLFVFMAFAIILGIASFNIFFCLAMLVIEKKRDISMLFSMGASKNMIRSIFMIEGSIIAFSGSSLGLSLGFMLCYLQDKYHLLGSGDYLNPMNLYPVEMRLNDFIQIGLVIVVITLLASIFPAKNAAKTIGSPYAN
ncbi:lipoprotein-releasing ABC transporter permease subunit LolE [Algivirga pacifica]|uniref:Lipoprotein-releasing ABC transporter permease subunit LolE n=1 Tax=Algivirga pacifica TaxID=1162670 RepID=A0ABP9DJK0_9BACT